MAVIDVVCGRHYLWPSIIVEPLSVMSASHYRFRRLRSQLRLADREDLTVLLCTRTAFSNIFIESLFIKYWQITITEADKKQERLSRPNRLHRYTT